MLQARRRSRVFAGPLDAVVLDADERQSLVAVRSLGRGGLCVGAFDDSLFPPAFNSRWCSTSGRLPNISNERAYLDAVLDVVRKFRPRALLVARDSTIEEPPRGGSIRCATWAKRA